MRWAHGCECILTIALPVVLSIVFASGIIAFYMNLMQSQAGFSCTSSLIVAKFIRDFSPGILFFTLTTQSSNNNLGNSLVLL